MKQTDYKEIAKIINKTLFNCPIQEQIKLSEDLSNYFEKEGIEKFNKQQFLKDVGLEE